MSKRRAGRPKADIRVVVGVPLGPAGVSPDAFTCLWEVARRGWELLDHGMGRTDVNRNELARLFLAGDWTHLVMLDTDHTHPPDAVERLVRWVVPQGPGIGKEVIGGLHFRRGEPFEPLMFVQAPGGAMIAPLTWPQGLVKVAAVGHGTLLVSRSALERLPGPWWQYDYSQWTREQPTLPSEDMYFCGLCRAAGIEVWCDTTLTSPHLLTVKADESTFRSWLASHPEQVKELQGP